MQILGYSISILGIASIVLSSGKFHDKIPLVNTIATKYLVIAGLLLVVVGIFLIMQKDSSSSKINQEKEEVPIYAGVGKNRKIVGYQKA
jgi:hypothetical protein